MTREIDIYFTTDMAGILKKLGMYEDAETGRLRCYFCRKPVNLQNIGGVFKHEGQVRVVCGDIKCLFEAASRRPMVVKPCWLNVAENVINTLVPCTHDRRKGQNEAQV